MSNDTIKVFISYSKSDKEFRDGLLAHLRPLETKGIITWNDRQILPGTRWDEEIKARLNAADIILLLISAAFLNTDYCNQVEIPEALRRHEAGEATVMPVILRSCGWNYTPLAAIQAYPEKAKPIESWPYINEAYTNVVDGVYLAATEIKNRRGQQRQEQQRRKWLEQQRRVEEQKELLKAQGQAEKEIGNWRKAIEAQIHQIKIKIVQAQRDYDLNQAAELRSLAYIIGWVIFARLLKYGELVHLYSELVHLQREFEVLDRWKTIKVRIHQINIKIVQAEQDFDLNQAAELKYGELVHLQRKFELLDRWKTIKVQIHQINIKLDQAERDYDLNRAAELKYGELVHLQQELEDIEAKLVEN